MKKSLATLILISAFLCIGLAPAVSAASSPKIGYFDLQTVLDKSNAGKRAKSDFDVKQKAMKADVEKKSKEFQKMKQDYEKKMSLLDDKAKREKVAALRKAQAEGEQLVMQTQKQLSSLSQELTKPIVDQILEIVRDIGKKDKYDLILEVQKGGIAYATASWDLTDTILKRLNKAMP